MQNPISVFNFQSHSVRTVLRDGEPWFVAGDACAVLGIKNHRESLRHLDDDEKGVISNDTLGGTQQIGVVNESGLYALVLRSRKPEARKFAKWVTGEVLPAIRKTGSYSADGRPSFSLLKKRWLVYFDCNGVECSKQIPSEAAIITVDQIQDLIADPAAVSDSQLADILHACTKRLKLMLREGGR